MAIARLSASNRADIDSQTDDVELIARRRSQMVTAATQCFGTKGYHSTTIKDIAEVAGFSPGLIYTYVREKEDVLFLVILTLLENYEREIPKAIAGKTDALERFCAAVETYCREVGRNVDATVLAYRETISLSRERQRELMRLELSTNKMISDCLEECIRAGYCRPVNVDLVSFRIVIFAHSWSLKAWHFRRVTTLDEYIREGLEFFLQALLTKAGQRRWEAIGSGEARGERRSRTKRAAT